MAPTTKTCYEVNPAELTALHLQYYTAQVRENEAALVL